MRRLFWGLLLMLLASCSEPPSPYHAIDVSWQHKQPAFELTDAGGKQHKLTEFRGRAVVLFFGYTHCPEVCPTTLADLAQVMHELGPDATRVQVIFVTLDPERDRPELLGKYVTAFNPAFLGLYGDAAATAAAAKAFGVNYEKRPDGHGSYTLDHTDGMYLIGPRGAPLLLSPYGQRPELLVQDIRMLLAVGR